MRIVSKRQPAADKDTPAAVAMGFFDGVHVGHVAVIGAARAYAKAHGLRLAVFTFGRGPKGDGQGRRLLTMEQKHRQLAALGVSTCYQPPFESFSQLAPEAFFEDMLVGEYGAQALFCGADFAFGARRAGDVSLLQKLCDARGVRLCTVPTTLYKGEAVSSSRIRAALAEGDILQVNAMLGRPYEIDFLVRHGKKLGSRLGVPTINQHFPAGIQPPAFGVYITQTQLKGALWPSATGFGTRPTVDNGPPSCETFIPGFCGNLYDKKVTVRFYQKIAEPHKFESLEALADTVRGWGEASAAYFAQPEEPPA